MLLAKQAAKLSPIRSNSASLKWLKNAMGAIGVSTKSVLREYSPNVSDAFASGASALRNISKSASNTRVDQAVRNNKYVQIANKAFRNAIDDIKSGNLAGVEDRSMKAMGFDWDNMFNDAPDGGLTFGDEGGGDVNIAYVDASGANDAGFSELANSMNRNTELTLKTGKAQMDAYIAMSSASLQQSAAMNEQVISHLAGIQNNLASLVEYNNTNMNKFIEASMAFYERTGAAMEKEDEGSKAVTASDVVKTGGSLNFSNYKQYIKEQLKKNLTGSQLGPIMSMIDEQTLEFFAANPLSMVTEGVVKLMMPKMFTTTIKGFEQTFSAMLPNMLHRLSEWGEKQSGSMMNRMLGTLAKSFGLNLNEKTNEIDRSQIKIERGAIPFDGETKNAITNIITKELREQTVYLKHIAGHFGLKGKKAKDALAEGSYFDYDSNQFITMKDLDNKILKSITDAIASGFNNTQFNKAMQRGITHSGGNTEEMQSLLNQFYVAMETSGKAARFDNGKIPDNVQKMIAGFSGSDAAKKNFTALMQQIVEQNPLVMMSLTQGTVNARAARNKSIDEILKNPSASGILHTSTFDGANLDALLHQYLGEQAKVATNAKPEGGGKYGPYSQVDMRGIMERSDLNVEFMELLDKFKARGAKGVKGVVSSIASGDTAAGVASVGKVFTDTAKDVGKMLNEHFFLPMRKTLFGEKDESGFSRGGFFSTAKNMIKDMTLETAHQLTGKEYTDSEGKHHEKIDNSVFGSIRAAIHEKFFGKEEVDEEGNPTGSKEQKGILSFITDSVKESFVNWHTAMFGELDEKGDKVTPENVTSKMQDYLKGKLPKAMIGGLGGGLFGLASGGLLGAMVGGPIGGVAIGAALGLASDSSKFRKWLFGDEDLDNGFISKKTQDFVKKNKNPLIAGAVLGGAKGLLGGGGFLGTLVGGPVAGAMLGMATATVAKSKTFHDFLFGDEEGYHKGIVNSFKDIFKATKEANKDAAGLSVTGKATGMALTGAAAGAITAGIVSKMGLLGSMLTPLGPVGGAMIGLGLSIRAQSDTFKKWLFGNGKSKSDDDYQAGVIGQFTNMLQVHMLRPFKRVVTDLAEDAAITLKYDVLGVIEKAFDPLTTGISKFVKGIIGKGKSFLNFIGRQAVDKLVSPVVNVVNKAIITPFTKLATGVAKLSYGVAKGLATLPFKIINKAVDWITSPIRKAVSKIFHPIKAVKFLARTFNNLLDKHLGWSFRPLGESVRKWVKGKAKGGIRAVGRGVKGLATAPFRLIGFAGDVAGGVGDYFAGKTVEKKGKNAANAELSKLYAKELKRGRVGTDDDGNVLDQKSWQRQYLLDHPELRNKYRDEFKDADKAQARLNRRERKNREQNEKLLAKASGYSRFEDTEENRAWLQRKDPKLYKKLKGKAVDSGIINDTAKMTEEQLGKADPSKMTNDVRKVHLLQQILNVLRGKNPDGSDKRRKRGRLFNNINLGHEGDAEDTYYNNLNLGNEGNERIFTNEDRGEVPDDTPATPENDTMSSIKKFMMDRGVSAEELDGLDTSGLTTLFLQKGFSFTDLMGSGLAKAKESVKENGFMSSILGLFSGKGYDEGTENTEAGIHVVGETAPELVMTGKGEKVLSGKRRALNVNISDLSQNVKAYLKKIMPKNTGGFSLGGGDDAEFSVSQRRFVPKLAGGAQAIKKLRDAKENREEQEERQDNLAKKVSDAKAKAQDLAVTADEKQAEIAQEEEKAKTARVQDAIIAMASSTQRQEEGGSKFHKLWASIFSKKGIITAGLIALAAAAISFFKNNGGLGGLILDLIKRVGEGAEEFVERIIEQFTEHTENGQTTDGEGASSEISEATDDITELANLDLMGYLENNNGDIDHRSKSKLNLLFRLARKPAKVFNAIYGFIKNKQINGTFRPPKGGYTQFGSNELLQRSWDKLTKEEAEAAVENATTNAVKDNVDNMASAAAKTATKEAAEEGTETAVQKTAEQAAREAIEKAGRNVTESTLDDAVQKTASQAARETVEKAASMATKEAVSETVEVSAKELAENATETAVKGTAKEVFETAAKEVTESAADDVIVKNNKVAKIAINTIKSFFDDICKYVSKHGGKKIASSAVGSLLKQITGVITKHIGKIASKLLAILGVNVALIGSSGGLAYVIANGVLLTIGAIDGISGTARLFHINKEDIDHPIMDIISAAFGAATATTDLGAFTDAINELVFAVLGIDIYNALACLIYRVFTNETKELELDKAQDKFQDSYTDYQEKEITQQYNILKATGIAPKDENGEFISEDAYIAGVRDGKYGAKYDSFADYNDKQNKSISGKVLQVGHDIIKTGAAAIKGIGGGLFGTKTEYYEDENGNRYYRDEEDGKLRVETKDGLRLGYVADSEDITSKLGEVQTEETEGLFGGIVKSVKDFGSSIKNKFTKKKEEKKKKEEDAAEKRTIELLEKQTSHVYVEEEAEYYYAPDGDGKYTRYSIGGVAVSETGAFSAADIQDLIHDNKVSAVAKSNFDNNFSDREAKMSVLHTSVNGIFDLGLQNSTESVEAKAEEMNELSKYSTKKGSKKKNTLNTKGSTVYYTPYGTFYKKSGSKWKEYSMIGEYLGSNKDISTDDFDNLLATSYLKKGTFKKNTKIDDVIKKQQDIANNQWTGGSNIFNTITNGISTLFGFGGNGTGVFKNSINIYPTVRFDGGFGSGSKAMGGGFGPSNSQPDTVNGFPYYAQNDKRWASTSYDYNGDGATLGDSGCGPSVMSMVLSKTTGKNVSPVELARYAQATGTRDNTGTNWNFIGNTARAAGLNVDQQYNPNADYIEDSVDAGNPVVLSGYSDGGNTPYTSAGHYIVAVGRDSNGNIKVNDPRGKAFSRSYKPEELSKYTGSAWSIGKSGGLGRRRRKRGGGRSGTDVMSKVGGFLTELGTRTVNGLLTGTFDNDWNSYWNPQTTTTTTTTTGTSTGGTINGGTNLTGNTTIEQIWNYLINNLGMTPAGAAGLMGNLEKESALIPNNVQDSSGWDDTSYTSGVDSGSYSRNSFVNDQIGYGLAQWTSAGRKAGLYDLVKSMNVSISDPAAQLSWLATELQNSYNSTYKVLTSTSDVREASDMVLHKFESPDDQSSSVENARYQASMKYYNQFAGSGSGKGNRLRLLNKRRGGRGYTAGEAREAVISWMLAIMNQNYYSQGKRHRVEEGLTGHGYGDCSSTVAWAYKKGTGLNIGTTTKDEWTTGTIIQQNTTGGAVPDESSMLPGDLIFFWGSGTSKTSPSTEMAHVEMYIGSGTLAGHGCDWGPFTKNMQEYCSGWKAGYCYVVRYITDQNAASLNVQFADPSLYKVQNTFTDGKGFSSNGVNTGVMPGGATSASTGAATASTSNSILDKVGGFFSELGTRTMNGLLTGTFDNDWNSYWSGVTTRENTTNTPTDTISTGASSSSGSSYPLYNLDDETKEFVAGVVAGETGGADSVAARQEASQMANLNEVHFKKQPNAESIKATLTSGWYATRSLRQSATDVTREAVETVMNNGRRTLPRYVTEHDMFPGDIKNAKDRSEYKVGDDVANIYGSKYKFYTFFGRDKKGDIAGYFPKDYEKYQNDVPWGGGAGTGAKLRRRNFSLSHPVSLGGHGEGDSGYKPRIGRASTYQPKRMGGFGIGVTSTTQTPESIVNSSLMGILQSAEQAKASGNTKAILSAMVELLGLIAENTGMSASAMQRANQLLSELKGLRGSTGKSTTTTSDVGGNTMGKLPEKVQKTTTASTKNMKLAQRIAAGK